LTTSGFLRLHPGRQKLSNFPHSRSDVKWHLKTENVNPLFGLLGMLLVARCAHSVKEADPIPRASVESVLNLPIASEQVARQMAIEGAKKEFRTEEIVIREVEEDGNGWTFFLQKPSGCSVGVMKKSGKMLFRKAM